MTAFTSVLVALSVLAAQGASTSAATPTDDLASVRELYAAASYEEALSRLSSLEERAAAGPEQLEPYRALCLLGLGRTVEAQRSLERLVTQRPLYRIADVDVSPRLVTMFRDVRQRMLPDAARAMYADAKTSFDSKQYSAASKRFAELMAILNDPDLGGAAVDLNDLKVLAQGFQQLADAQAAEEARARAEALSKARAVANEAAATEPGGAGRTPAPARPAAPAIYVETDPGVTPPVQIERRLPPWNPPTRWAVDGQYRGVLEIIINERGQVETATLRDSVAAFYDASLLQAAMAWKYRPATHEGRPVKFRKFIEIVQASK
jgi:hypothetical protein